ncbi:transcriptional repressor [Oscillospiraceae bacterium PP1C4]
MYQTEQLKCLLGFLRANAASQFTIEKIADTPQISEHLGKSTVYRLMSKLLQEGVVKRFAGKTGRGFLYQYVNPCECHSHLHLKCISCGKLIHLEDDISQHMVSAIEVKNDFEIDSDQTVLYGKCVDCNK